MKRVLFVLVCGLGGLTAVALASPLHTQNNPISLADYWQQLADLQTQLSALETAEQADQQAALNRAATELEAITAVTLPDGRVVPIRSSFLVSQLKADEPDIEAVGHMLAAVLTEKEAWPAAGVAYDADVLAAVLAREEFNYTPEAENFLQKLWQDFTRQFSELLARFLEGTGLAGVLPTALNIFGAVALALVIYYAISGLVADFSASSQLDEEGLEGEFLTADLALRRAEELSTGGDYRTAVRYLYLSSLLLLEERGLLRYDRSLTNREYLRTIGHKPHLTAVLRQVIDVFDRVWYGFQPISKASYDEYARQVDSLKQQKGEEA